ncbi:MAG TPA: DUF92 domain-containing protein [Anaerolineales bacterium]|jgi:uncharacterized protein (TIGR00297 family)
MQIFAGFFLAAIIAFAAFRVHSLSRSGALAAMLVGTVIFGIGGWQWALLLLAFFITSTALTRAFKQRKTGLSEKFSKGGQRDAGQVLGNGGLATLFAGLHYFFPTAPWVWLAFAACLAAVNADTWSTELGVLNPHPPRMITNPGRVVEKGTSGGISVIGTLAALAGSALIGLLAVLFPPAPVYWTLGVWVTLAGFLGSLFDSLLGATVQAIYYCPACDKETERHPFHTCGTPTTLKRGWSWLNNDIVNLGCAVFAVIFVLVF